MADSPKTVSTLGAQAIEPVSLPGPMSECSSDDASEIVLDEGDVDADALGKSEDIVDSEEEMFKELLPTEEGTD